MTSTVLAVATLHKISGIPDDAVQNTFVFGGLSTPPLNTELDNITTSITAFYNGTSPNQPIYTYLSSSLSTAANANTIAYYLLDGHLDGSPHGSPIRTDHWSLGGHSSSEPFPDEVAVVLSYHRNYGTDVEFGTGTRPRARDRGRVYIGPLSTSAGTTNLTTGEVFVTTAFITDLTDAAHQLTVFPSATPWVQWSRTKADTALVVGGWVDNAFDSQRRRSNQATVRTAWTA